MEWKNKEEYEQLMQFPKKKKIESNRKDIRSHKKHQSAFSNLMQ